MATISELLRSHESVSVETKEIPFLDDLLAELAESWRNGTRLRVEVLLDRYPSIREEKEAVVRLIYEEVCLREERGEAVLGVEIVARFPQLKSELEVLVACHDLLQAPPAQPHFPEIGQEIGDFELLAELGRGCQGRVFLARQHNLADRPVVLKMSSCEGKEHVSLARLQHTHIVPLYALQDIRARNLRLLCMPYLGGATLSQILLRLMSRPIQSRTGEDVLIVMDQLQKKGVVAIPRHEAVRNILRRATYTQAICWIGMCLAEALDYAHQRGLVHLDVKPSNVLVAADGQPLLLDFHLSREPLRPGTGLNERFGGTPAYMSPEQRRAISALMDERDITDAVDGRSDLYSLAVTLFEALGGIVTPQGTGVPAVIAMSELRAVNPQVSVGLADMLGRCLAEDPEQRYPTGAALAEDLRRHLSNLPLSGVRNRSLSERWRKWRLRSPQALLLTLLFLLLSGLTFLGVGYASAQRQRQVREIETALVEGKHQIDIGEPEQAIRTLERAGSLSESTPGTGDMAGEIQQQHRRALRALAARQLHSLVEHLGFLFGADSTLPPNSRNLLGRCAAVWQQREGLLQQAGTELSAAVERQLQSDLLDLVLIWTDLQTRLAPVGEQPQARQRAVQILDEAETLLGKHAALERERATHTDALGWTRPAVERTAAVPQSIGNRIAPARSLLRREQYSAAAEMFQQILNDEPRHFWANFHWGVCEYRLGRFENAEKAFSICIALSERSAECWYNRGLVRAARGKAVDALQDYNRVLQLDANFASASFNRGLLHSHAGRLVEAERDFTHALRCGIDNAAIRYELARVQWERQDRVSARTNVQKALAFDPNHALARDLLRELERSK